MNYLEFRSGFIGYGCFNIHQVMAMDVGFDRNNLTRWIKAGYLIKLRQGWYTFTELALHPDNMFYFANKMYAPSYISLHSALSFYGLIPEAVLQVTSVSTLKTNSFTNTVASFTYKSLTAELFFGYEPKAIGSGKHILIATREKALLDLLYLYPFYRSAKDMEGLRLDEDILHEELNKDLMEEYIGKAGVGALEKRIRLLFKTYEL